MNLVFNNTFTFAFAFMYYVENNVIEKTEFDDLYILDYSSTLLVNRNIFLIMVFTRV